MDYQICRDLISRGFIEDAISRLRNHIQGSNNYKSFFRHISLIEAKFRRLQKSEIVDEVDHQSWLEIQDQILRLIDELEATDEFLLIDAVYDGGEGTKSLIFRRTHKEFYNEDFYEHFNSVLANAKTEILITGEGFECVDKRGKEIAQEYSSATENALRNGVTVTRIQTKLDVSEDWKKHLLYFLKRYPEQFKLFLVNDGKPVDLASICLIDTNASTEDNIVEFMLSISERIKNERVKIAGLALFIHGVHDLNLSLRERFYDIQRNRTIQITEENLNAYLGKRSYYFAYGANMDKNTILERCPSAEKVGIGVIDNYDIVFNRKGTYRTGGVSSIEPTLNGKVFGIIYSITESDLFELDSMEDPSAYLREEKQIKVFREQSKSYPCQLYLAFRQQNLEPDKEYLDLLIKASETENLPNWYIKRLKRFRK